jgi:hypothetical protein
MECSDWDIGYEVFQEYTTTSAPPPSAFVEVKSHKLVAVYDSGKYRLVTLGSKWQHLLAPLHHLIYDHLTSRETVIRGNPRPSTFEGFTHSTDLLCSGDYEASTDNLSSLHALHILRDLRSRSTYVPEWIWDLAEASLTGTVEYTTSDKRTKQFDQSTGQLMGNYLSFPLLCISNIATLFLAFGSTEAWRMVHNGLVRVNGDDIVFRAKIGSITRWKESLPDSGFVVNPSKTSVHDKLLPSIPNCLFVPRNAFGSSGTLYPKGYLRRPTFRWPKMPW